MWFNFEGKLTSYNFFNNVVKQLRNIANNVKTDDLCGICLSEIEESDTGVTKCGHIFCYECIKLWTSKKSNCPYCKKIINNDELYLLSYDKVSTIDKNIPKSDQDLIENVGTKLANLIFYLRENDKHTIIFSQWDRLLTMIGQVLKVNDVSNVFCKGNVHQRNAAISAFRKDTKKKKNLTKVIMLSTENAASGTNLTEATHIIFMEPIKGSKEHIKTIEDQAIGRAVRLGQENQVIVYKLIIKDSIGETIFTQ